MAGGLRYSVSIADTLNGRIKEMEKIMVPTNEFELDIEELEDILAPTPSIPIPPPFARFHF
jgi:hypothetical protein